MEHSKLGKLQGPSKRPNYNHYNEMTCTMDKNIELTRKVFLHVISNFFGKNTVNRIRFELLSGKNQKIKLINILCKLKKEKKKKKRKKEK